MSTDINQALHGVITSSREILKNNQKHYYSNMLNLLDKTCKTILMGGNKVYIEEFMNLCLKDVLPLVFDENDGVSTNAINVIEQGIKVVGTNTIHSCAQWPEVKNNITKTYAPLVNKLREKQNPKWQSIWSILIRLLDKEILKGASTINAFLSTVELGFRNSDNTARQESFNCWRLLIKIFADHNELTAIKRIKLICIPLKSSHSKAMNATNAEMKLRVWWYLITSLRHNIKDLFTLVLGPFLSFGINVAQNIKSLRKIIYLCFASLLTVESVELLDKCLLQQNLELLTRPLHIVSPTFLEQHWKPLVIAIIEMIKLINDSANDDEQSKTEKDCFSKIFLRFVLFCVLRLDSSTVTTTIVQRLQTLPPPTIDDATFIIKTIENEGLTINRSINDLHNYQEVLSGLMHLLVYLKSPEVAALPSYQKSFDKIFTMKPFLNANRFRGALDAAFNVVNEDDKDMDFRTSFAVKMGIWCHITNDIVEALRTKIIKLDDDEDGAKLSNDLTRWTLWPVKSCLTHTEKNQDNSWLDVKTCVLWDRMLNSLEITQNLSDFIKELRNLLQNLLTTASIDSYFGFFFDSYTKYLVQHESEIDLISFEDFFKLFQQIIMRQLPLPKQSIETCFNGVHYCLVNLKQNKITDLFEIIKETMALLSKTTVKNIEKSFLNAWKKTVLDYLKTNSTKNVYNTISELLKEKQKKTDDDGFVRIETVWTLNPERLTEHQKERFAEKPVIPALYNDMSQSNDTPLQPWTPKKVINPISNNSQKENDIDYTINSEQSKDPIPNSDNERKEPLVETVVDKNHVLPETTIPKPPQQQAEPVTTESKNMPIATSENVIKPLQEMKPNQFVFSQTNGRSLQARRHSICHVPLSSLDVMSKDDELSPKKLTTKFGLSSPPDRKQTNNSRSPTLRPKPSAHMTGRGAQLINMIRSKKLDSAASTSTAITSVATITPKQSNLHTIQQNVDKMNNHNQDGGDVIYPIRLDITSTPTPTAAQSNDLLVFSKVLPSPAASPSVSILKRRMLRDSLDENLLETPASKRKRVSFHDPPVSITKEYLKDDNENGSKTKRCLMMDKNTFGGIGITERRLSLKRRSRADSLTEFEKCSIALGDNGLTPMETNSNTDTTVPELNEAKIDFTTLNEEDLLNHFVEQCPMEKLLEKYFTKDENQQTQNAHIATFSKFVAQTMSKNEKVKANILENISEKHSKDLLDYAIRENLASVVCDRLNIDSIIDYVDAKAKIDSSCRANLFTKIIDIQKHNQSDDERISFIRNLLNNCQFTDSLKISLIATLVAKQNAAAVADSSNN